MGFVPADRRTRGRPGKGSGPERGPERRRADNGPECDEGPRRRPAEGSDSARKPLVVAAETTLQPARGLLAIFAHPDDESYGAGGVMALAAAAGNPVWVLCATNGDQGGRPGEVGVDHSM